MSSDQNPYPNIIDNKHQKLGDVLAELLSKSEYAKIVSGFFYVEGFNLVSSYAQDTKIDIVIGCRTTKATKEEFEEYLDFKQNKEDIKEEFENSLECTDEENKKKGTLNLFELMKKRNEDESKGIKFYIFKQPPLHAKVYFFGLKQEHKLLNINSLCVFGSSNFTPAGLGYKTGNIEFNAQVSEPAVLRDIEKWFDEFIVPNSEDLNTDLLKIIGKYKNIWKDEEEGYKYVKPLKFVKLLIKYFHAENLLDSLLLPHQINDYIWAKKSIEENGGCIIASSVGLGKSYVASQLIKDYLYNEEGKKIGEALLIGRPGEVEEQWMADSTEKIKQGYLRQNGVNPKDVKYISMYEFQGKKFNPEEYKKYNIIAIDEVHNFRNRERKRYQNLMEAIKKIRNNTKDTKFITLTGTPINNTPADLYNLINIFFDDERFKRNNLITHYNNLEEYNTIFKKIRRFEREEDLSDENKKDLNDLKKRLEDIKNNDVKKLINELMPRTTRLDLKEIYKDMDLVINGEKITLKDPVLIEANKRYDLYDINPYCGDVQKYKKVYGEMYERYEKDGKQITKVIDFITNLNLPHLTIYNPFKQESEKGRLPGIYKVQLYKRLESSIYSFYKSLCNLEEKDNGLLKIFESASGLNEINKRLKESYAKMSQKDVRDFVDEELSEDIKLTENDLSIYKQYTTEDLEKIKNFKKLVEKLRIGENSFVDPKLDVLKEFINNHKREKILLFSQFADTINYLDNCLEDIIKKEEKVKITGLTENKIEQLYKFKNEENTRLLLSTDTLSEGVNIPEADIIINYDLPWNPVRLIQRIGRVDRLSNNKDIWVKNFIPEDKFDKEIELVKTLKQKITNIIEFIGGEYPVLTEEELHTIIENTRNNKLDEIEKNYADTKKGDLYNLINFITKVIYVKMREKDPNLIKEEINNMEVPKSVFYTNLSSKQKGIGFFYLINEKDKLDKVSLLSYIRKLNGDYDKEFPLDVEFEEEYKGRLTDETKDQIKNFEEKKLIELRHEGRKAQYVLSNSDIDNYKQEIVREINKTLQQTKLNKADKEINKMILSFLSEFGKKNVSIQCEKEMIDFRRKWIKYKGKSKNKTNYKTKDMNENKQELYNDLKELNEKMSIEIKKTDDIDGKLKAFIIFD
ncbi:MAG: hypothetical protein CVT88_01390 [Candidatus Altiarchaeales archaeon HGW-Altiarchaeales-1]|nr:MAG: hypothetical protein CVT88_01390 [Candidatus Altiarchaeales archaeon HGW-Altiarchaeales-1]